MGTTLATTETSVGIGSGRVAKTIIYYAAFVLLGLSYASLGPTLGSLAQHTRSPLSAISFLFMVRSLGYLAGSLIGGRLYDRMPGHRVMGSILVIMSAMLILSPIVPSLWLLMAVMLVLGMGEGAVDVGGNTLLVWTHRSAVGPYMNGLHFCWGLGAFISPLIVAQVMQVSGDIHWAYWVLAALAMPVAYGLLRLPSPTAESHHDAGATGQVTTWLVILIASFLFLYVGAEGSLGGWIFTYLTKLGLGSEATAAYLTSAFWGALTVGRLLAIPLAVRLRPRSILLIDLAGCLISMGLVVLMPNSITAIWIGTLGTGLAMASIFPTTISLAESRMKITGQVTSWFFVGASLGGMTVPWLIGQRFESSGPRVTIWIILADLIVAVGVFVAMMLSARRAAK